MKIAVSQLNYTIGDIEGNSAKIIREILRAKGADADLVIFSELSVCGYPPKDLLDYPNFINRCQDALDQIRLQTENIGVLVGAPTWTN